EGARPGALPRRHPGAEALQRVVRRREPQALAAEPHAALPRLPRGQGGLPVHAVGDPELLDLRLAAAVLPDERRLHRDVQGADRAHGLAEVRPGHRPPLRQRHGPLRLRADRRADGDEVAQTVAARVRLALTRRDASDTTAASANEAAKAGSDAPMPDSG